MKQIPSPNFNDRVLATPLNYILIHYTGMQDAQSACARLCDPSAEVSAHYMIDEAGEVLQLVDEGKRAWHAGKSFWRGLTDINSASIGIELVNPGHEWGYRAFPDPQITALEKLLKDIIQRHKLNPLKSLLAHSDVAPQRKEDPGEYFPWQRLAQKGLGFWPKAVDYSAEKENEIYDLLNAIGYDTTDIQKTLLAFQRRFYPENLTSRADQETLARLRCVKSLWSD